MSRSNKTCCTPPRSEAPGALGNDAEIARSAEERSGGVVDVPGGTALVGTRTEIIPHDGEAPLRQVKLAPFAIDEIAVTNERFARFVAATEYVTEAERFGWSFAFFAHMPADAEPTQGVAAAPWWRRVEGATWRAINGPGTEGGWQPDHPVVHVSWNDAQAFAIWAGGRLPHEAECEQAARGGLGDVRSPWGDEEPNDEDFFPCNIWQGEFPERNIAADGYAATAPAKSFEPNGYGLYNMSGNTWEWTADSFKIRSLKSGARRRQSETRGFVTAKGGSFLCHRSYCYRYRIAARSGNSPDSTTAHQGFRLVYDR